MKIQEVVFIISLVITSISHAWELSPLLGFQSNTPSTVQMSYSSITGQGARFGALTKIELLPTFFARTGLVWSQRDFQGKIELKQLGVTLDFKQKISYVDIPLNVQWNFSEPNIYIFGGFVYSLKVNDSYEYSPTLLASLGLSENNPHKVANSDTLLNLGFGYSFCQQATSKFLIEVEYDYGLTNINDTASSSGKINERSLVLNWLFTQVF